MLGFTRITPDAPHSQGWGQGGKKWCSRKFNFHLMAKTQNAVPVGPKVALARRAATDTQLTAYQRHWRRATCTHGPS